MVNLMVPVLRVIYDKDYVYVINSGQVSYALVKKDITPVFDSCVKA